MDQLERRPTETVADTHRRHLLRDIKDFIEERLADPDLSPATIAEAQHISVRYLHKLYVREEMTVASWIKHRRLERCRRDLEDSATDGRPVSAIGARWGFIDPASFNRVFRAEYGLPPGAYRQMCA